MRLAERTDADIVDDSAKQEAFIREVQSRQSKPGTYDFISPLLDRRRLEHVMPEGVFRIQAAFDRIYVFQIGMKDTKKDETYGDTRIIMPQIARDNKRQEIARGIVVSAGLKAQEELFGNGIAVGHIVSFLRNAPWAKPVDNVVGTDIHVFVMRAGDLDGSEDLMTNLKHGTCKKVEVRIPYDVKNDRGETVTLERLELAYMGEDGKVWDPRQPWIPDDF